MVVDEEEGEWHEEDGRAMIHRTRRRSTHSVSIVSFSTNSNVRLYGEPQKRHAGMSLKHAGMFLERAA